MILYNPGATLSRTRIITFKQALVVRKDGEGF